MGKGKKIGCGIGILLVLVVGAFVWLSFSPTGGVKLGNEIDEYAIQHISDHNLLMQGEKLIAYYDVTLSLDGSESAIITNKRIIYYKKGRVTSIDLENIKSINHRYENFVGDIIEVEEATGEYFKVEIAPMNNGETFLNVLRSNWERTKNK